MKAVAAHPPVSGVQLGATQNTKTRDGIYGELPAKVRQGTYQIVGRWVPQAPDNAVYAPVFDSAPIAEGVVRLVVKGLDAKNKVGGRDNLAVEVSFEFPVPGKSGKLRTRGQARASVSLRGNGSDEKSLSWLGGAGDQPFLVGVTLDRKTGKVTGIVVRGEGSVKFGQVLPMFVGYPNTPVVGF